VLVLTIAIVGIYSYFGGLWTSTVTATLGALIVSTPAAVAVLYVLYKVGGPNYVFDHVKHLRPSGGPPFWMWRWDTASTFGISLGLGLLANTICDQSFWQRVWGMRPQNLARTFVWAGWWFYPIPLTLGLLGLVALAVGVTPADLGSFGAGGAGPYVMSHLGLPTVIICVYVLTVITACFSATDGAFSGISSLTAIDLVKRLKPNIREKSLFRLTKLSIPIAGIIGAIVVSSGIDYVNLVTFIYFIDIGLALPLVFALFWHRYSSVAFLASLFISEAAGIPVRQLVSPLDGLIVLLGTSALVSVAVTLLGKERFDFSRLATPDALTTEVQETVTTGGIGVPAAASESVA
jgi:Na+/proline symporter